MRRFSFFRIVFFLDFLFFSFLFECSKRKTKKRDFPPPSPSILTHCFCSSVFLLVELLMWRYALSLFFPGRGNGN